MDASNLFLTGPPRIGKTTICEAVITRLSPRVRGFLTRELREDGDRVGFELETVSGDSKVLSHVSFEGGPSVGKYVVDVEVMDTLACRELEAVLNVEEPTPVVVDEVGKMELLSDTFRRLLEDVLESDHPIVATAPLNGPAEIEAFKERPDAHVIRVTSDNRDDLPEKLVRTFAGKNVE